MSARPVRRSLRAIEDKPLQPVRCPLPGQSRHGLGGEASAAACIGPVREYALQCLDNFLDTALAPSGHRADARAVTLQRRLTVQWIAILRLDQIEVTGVA